MEEKLTYMAILHFEGKSGIGVTFPDFPGCVTQADTVDEVLSMAQEALLLHIEGMIEDGEDMPPATEISEIMLKNRDKVAFVLVSVPDPQQRERINLSVTAGDLAKIDQAASRAGMNRSSFMVKAAVGWGKSNISGRLDWDKNKPSASTVARQKDGAKSSGRKSDEKRI